MSTAAAIHPDKFVITEELYARGFRILLRGEQTFGFAEREYSTAGVLNKLGVRRFGDVDLLLQLAHPDLRATMTDGSDRIVDALIQAGERLEPNDFTHRAYFSDRYQRLSGATAYYKQVLMDHRSPLMDNTLLDIIQRLPQTCRDDKALLYYIVKTRYPELAGFDYASRTNLEDWAGLFAADTPVRRYASAEFSDASSGLWDFLNRDTACKLLAQAAAYRPAPPRATPLKDAFKPLRPALYKTWQRLAARMRLSKGGREIPSHVAILRILVLKNWYDTFAKI
jgi:hypothetical protein